MIHMHQGLLAWNKHGESHRLFSFGIMPIDDCLPKRSRRKLFVCSRNICATNNSFGQARSFTIKCFFRGFLLSLDVKVELDLGFVLLQIYYFWCRWKSLKHKRHDLKNIFVNQKGGLFIYLLSTDKLWKYSEKFKLNFIYIRFLTFLDLHANFDISYIIKIIENGVSNLNLEKVILYRANQTVFVRYSTS